MAFPFKKPRKTDEPASVAELAASSSELALAIADAEEKWAAIAATLDDLSDAPAAFRDAFAERSRIETVIARLQREKGAIDSAIPEAEKREAAAAHNARTTELERAGRRLVKDAPKIIAEANALLAPLLAALAQHRDDVTAHRQAGCELGIPAEIDDAEFTLRAKPGQVHPAITETREAWLGPDGKPTNPERWNPARMRHEVRSDVMRGPWTTVIREEIRHPPSIPGDRLTELVKLFDVEGRQVWPPIHISSPMGG